MKWERLLDHHMVTSLDTRVVSNCASTSSAMWPFDGLTIIALVESEQRVEAAVERYDGRNEKFEKTRRAAETRWLPPPCSSRPVLSLQRGVSSLLVVV
jgi:hypothetical protein